MTGDSSDWTDCNPGRGNCRGDSRRAGSIPAVTRTKARISLIPLSIPNRYRTSRKFLCVSSIPISPSLPPVGGSVVHLKNPSGQVVPSEVRPGMLGHFNSLAELVFINPSNPSGSIWELLRARARVGNVFPKVPGHPGRMSARSAHKDFPRPPMVGCRPDDTGIPGHSFPVSENIPAPCRLLRLFRCGVDGIVKEQH